MMTTLKRLRHGRAHHSMRWSSGVDRITSPISGSAARPRTKPWNCSDARNAHGNFRPFHVYSMKQSISEGFTLDVLQNYNTFKRYFQLVESVEKDEEKDEVYDTARTLRALTTYVDSAAPQH